MGYMVEALGFILIVLKLLDYIDLEWKIVLMPWILVICARVMLALLTMRDK